MASESGTPEVGAAAAEAPRATGRTIAGWIMVALGIAWAIFVYYGLGVPPGGLPTDWWHARQFLLDVQTIGAWVDAPHIGGIVLSIPGLLLAIGAFWGTRSAIARALALSSIFAASFFAFCGLGMMQPWEFFSWRLTAVLVLSSLAIGSTLASPLLVRSWLRRSALVRALIYAPLFFAVVAAVRGATGTSEKMAFLVSPWPMFTVFGLETAVVILCGILLGVAIGTLSLARGIGGVAPIIGAIVAVTLPGLWTRTVLGKLDAAGFIGLGVVTAIAIAASLFFSSRGSDRIAQLQSRALCIALGAAMAFVPIFSGRALAAGDFTINRYVRAPKIIEALQAHIKNEEFYPEKLTDLVDAGYLDEAPVPRIGFAFLSTLGLADPIRYRYSEYGQSFVLEFDSSYWVQCTYSGNYYLDEEEAAYEEELADEEDDEGEEEYEDEEYAYEDPWSCLGKRPALFGGEQRGGSEE